MEKREVNLYVLRKGKDVIIANRNKERVLNEQFFRGGTITKEKVLVKEIKDAWQ